MATAETTDILSTDNFVVTEVIPGSGDGTVVETIPIAEQSEQAGGIGASEIVADSADMAVEPSTSSGSTVATAVMKTIIEALAAASSVEMGGATDTPIGEKGEADGGSEAQEEEHQPSESSAQTNVDDSNSTAIAAAALQALASQMSTDSQMSSSDAIAHLQQVLNIPIEDIPAAATSLVNEVASEVIVMAQAAQHATMAAESMIEGISGNEAEEDDDDGEDEEVPEEEELLGKDKMEWESPRVTKMGKLKMHKCPECGKGFGLTTTLARHIHLHSKEKKCQHCDSVFFSPAKLAKHIRVNHTQAEKQKNAICQLCGKAFYNNAKLRVHMRSHTGDRPYKCSYCEKSFTSSSHRKRHERLHTGELPYVCPHCEKGFSSPSNLRDHIFVHTKENPYKCSECGKGFTQWGAMQRHKMAIHEKRKDVKCDVCGKFFARKDYLKLHIQKCHWSKCNLCKESFEKPEELQRHMETCTATPTKRRNSPDGKVYAARSAGQKRTPSVRTTPRKRARSAPKAVVKRRKLTTPTRIDRNLMAIYDQFEDDPLADPNYHDTEEIGEQAQLEEIVEEEGVGIDTEEVLEQEQVLQTIEELEEAENATDKPVTEEEVKCDAEADGDEVANNEGLPDKTDAGEEIGNEDKPVDDDGSCDKPDAGGDQDKEDGNETNSVENAPELTAAGENSQQSAEEGEDTTKGNAEGGGGEVVSLQQEQLPATGDTLESLMDALVAAATCEEQQNKNEEKETNDSEQ